MTSLTHVVGWTLIHFLWQGAILAIVAAVVLWLCRSRSADVRYVSACVVFGAMLAAPVITAYALMTPATATVVRSTDVTQDDRLGTGSIASQSVSGHGVLSMNAKSIDLEAWLPAVVFVWLAGVIVLSTRMAGGLWRVRRLHRESLASATSRWHTTAERIASQLGLRAAVHVIESSVVDVPVAIGWLRPVILLPVAAFANLTPSQIEAILAHELNHIRRKDFLINVAQTVAETLLFFHPAVWWLSGRIREEREHCCDDVAVRVCGDPLAYATALAELEAMRSCRITLALAATDGSLTGRVRRVLNLPLNNEGRSLSLSVTVVIACLSAVVMSSALASPFGHSAAPASAAGSAQVVDTIASPGPFEWRTHSTSHFDVYYYPALTSSREQVAASAERAYRRVSSELQHDLAFRIPLVLFKTRSDFSQQTVIDGLGEAIGRGDVTAFSEPTRNRMVILVDEQPDRLYRLLVHELTHIFAFDIIPRSEKDGRRPPVWIDEGLADYMTGEWDPDALAQIRELVASMRVPRIASLPATLDSPAQRVTIHLGQALFDFIEAEYGKPAVWQLLVEIRRSLVDGGGDFFQSAFNRTPDEIDSAFNEYLQRRFTP